MHIRGSNNEPSFIQPPSNEECIQKEWQERLKDICKLRKNLLEIREESHQNKMVHFDAEQMDPQEVFSFVMETLIHIYPNRGERDQWERFIHSIKKPEVTDLPPSSERTLWQEIVAIYEIYCQTDFQLLEQEKWKRIEHKLAQDLTVLLQIEKHPLTLGQKVKDDFHTFKASPIQSISQSPNILAEALNKIGKALYEKSYTEVVMRASPFLSATAGIVSSFFTASLPAALLTLAAYSGLSYMLQTIAEVTWPRISLKEEASYVEKVSQRVFHLGIPLGASPYINPGDSPDTSKEILQHIEANLNKRRDMLQGVKRQRLQRKQLPSQEEYSRLVRLRELRKKLQAGLSLTQHEKSELERLESELS